MSVEEVINLLKTSKSEVQWNNNVDEITRRCNGYPDFWFTTVIMSGLMNTIAAQWGGSDKITITSY